MFEPRADDCGRTPSFRPFRARHLIDGTVFVDVENGEPSIARLTIRLTANQNKYAW